jgi:GxxExxY protein
LVLDLRSEGLGCETNKQIEIFYSKTDIGDISTDIIVNDQILISIETDLEINPIKGQVLHNYLKSSRYEVGLLLNFGESPEQIRKQFLNDIKDNID